MSVIEATVTSKGQVTLPKAVRTRLGIRTGSRIRFTLPPTGGFEAHPVLCELEDLWAMVDEAGPRAGKARPVMSFDEMNAAKARRAGR
ncbi:MAG: AbrB/MazE/SpoVT family DNA-binding domain-containing protein [Acidobacteriaceae bacterium]